AEGDAQSHAEAIVAKAAEIDVSVLAITDHNNVIGVAAFREAAEDRGITIFPGFELSSSEGIHILCIYPPDTVENQLGRYLGEFGIRDTKPSSTPSPDPFDDILEKVRGQGGLAIAAHITNDKGLFKVLTGQSRINAWQNKHLLAVQIPGAVEDLPNSVHQIIKNKNPDYRRAHPAGESLAVAAVNARDVVKPEDLTDHSATCWIKMSEATIEGLRQAFLDPESRIRLNPKEGELEPEEHAELVSLAWEGGLLAGVDIHLNPNLNVLVGGRGAGKSTVIESLRYVLGLAPVGEEADKAHQGIVQQVLKNGTKISLCVRSYRPAKREYRIERTVPNPPVVRDENSQVLDLLPKDIFPRIEVYGQHEISELTRSREKLTHLLDRFVEHDQSLSRRKADVSRELEKTRRSILDVRAELQQIEERLSMLPGLEEKLTRFQEAGLEDRLREQSLLVREERLLDSIPERLQPFYECLDLLRQALPIDRVFLSSKALQDLPGREILAGVDEILKHLSSDTKQVMRQLEEVLERRDGEIANVRSLWNDRKREVQNAYEKILRELQQSAIDGEEFIRLRREIEDLRPLRERRSLLRLLENEQLDQRRNLLAEWEDLKAEEFRLLDQAARDVNKKLRDNVQVAVTAAGNREPLVELLRSEIGGNLATTIEKLKSSDALSLIDLAKTCRDGAEELQEKYGLTPAQARNIAEAAPEVFMCIEELELPPTTAIQLNTAPYGEPPIWQALEALSTGQKATAVLLLLLLESDAPLIVDQPEDDLDNRFVTESIVPRMREEKRRRQFLFSTHNANIPVLGDAELILGLTTKGDADIGQAWILSEHMGSIDKQSVRALVEELLEGGKDAFETRRLKYGF
ncbi:MAG: AAA family ATPase, partial [Candidatus Poribacteria bacterium]|nr:AAA family ATPase [Candidatus Poribacteria bacterium]